MLEQNNKLDSKAIVEKIVEDIEQTTYMGSMMLALSPAQRERMKRRWAMIIDGMVVESDWATY